MKVGRLTITLSIYEKGQYLDVRDIHDVNEDIKMEVADAEAFLADTRKKMVADFDKIKVGNLQPDGPAPIEEDLTTPLDDKEIDKNDKLSGKKKGKRRSEPEKSSKKK